MTWKTLPLGELCEVLDSKRKPITKKHRVAGSFPYYGATGIVDYVNDYIFDEKLVLVGEDGAKWGSGDMTAFIAQGKYWVNNHAHVLKPFRNVMLDEWLVYYFYYKDLKEYVSGLTVPKLNQGQLKLIPIPIPPLSTQEKLVAKLDLVFAQAEKATIASQVNAKNAEALFQSYLVEIFEGGGESWIEKLTGDICSKITDGKHGDCVNEDNSGYYFLSAKDIKNGSLNYNGSRQITKRDFEETHRRTNLECGDVLVTNSGTIGRMAIATNDPRTVKTTFQKSVAILKPKTTDINSKFLFHLLTSKLLHFNNISAGAAQKNLLLRDIRSLKIKFPVDIDEQIQVSNKCDFIRDKTYYLVQHYENRVNEINHLKQSILKKAFDGELVKD